MPETLTATEIRNATPVPRNRYVRLLKRRLSRIGMERTDCLGVAGRHYEGGRAALYWAAMKRADDLGRQMDNIRALLPAETNSDEVPF